MNVHIEIDRLIVDDRLAAGQTTEAVRSAVERELRRRVEMGARDQLSVQSGRVASAEAPSIRVSPSDDAVGLGRQIAGSIYGGITS